MQFHKDDIRQKIIIFNNEFISEGSSDIQSNRNSKFKIQNNENIHNHKEQEELELNLTLENDEKINIKLNLDENIEANIYKLCKEYNINKKGQHLILEIIKSKIAEIKGEKSKNFNVNNNINNENNNKKSNNKDFNNIIYNNKLNNNSNKINNNIINDDIIPEKKIESKNEKKIIVHKRKLKENNLGQNLFIKGMKFNDRKKNKIERIKTEILKQKPKYDFKPKLSKKSLEITKNNRNKMKIEDRLISLGNEQKKKKLIKIAQNKFLEDKNNKLILKSKNKSKNKKIKRNKSEDIFNRLYKEKDILKEKAEINQKIYFKKIYPFKPKISKMAKNMKNDKYNDIIKRYKCRLEQINEKILQKEEEEEKNNTINKTAEIKSYQNINNSERPKNFFIQKNINNIRNIKIKSKTPIKNDSNYSYQKENLKYIFDEQYSNEIEEEREKLFDKKANNIMKKLKENKLKEIFKLLDKNNEGFLSYSNISFSNVEPGIMDALTSLIAEINKNKDKKIFFNEFKMLTNDSLIKCMMEDN